MFEFMPVVKFFEDAPKLRALTLPGVKVSRSSSSEKYWVTDGGSFGQSRFYGTLLADGTYRPSFRDGNDGTYWGVTETLEALRCPEDIATMGRASGRCCYCARTLTVGESVDRGYGPICANYHGLPYGK